MSGKKCLFLYLVTFIVFLTGCSQKNRELSGTETTKKENVQVSGTESGMLNVVETNWQPSFKKLNIQSLNSLIDISNGTIYVVEARADQVGKKLNYFFSNYDQEGNQTKEIQLQIEEDYHLKDFSVGKEGSILLLGEKLANSDTAGSSHLMKFDNKGNLLFSVDASSYFPDVNQLNFVELMEGPGGEIYFLENIKSKIVCLNPDGSLLRVIEESDKYISTLFFVGEDHLYGLGEMEGNKYLWGIDTGSGTIDAEGYTLKEQDVRGFLNGDASKLFVQTSRGLKDFSFEDGEGEMVIDWVTAGISSQDIKKVAFLSSASLAVITQSVRDEMETELVIFTKSDEPIQKEVLTLATLDPGPELLNQVLSYNKFSESYSVYVNNYYDASSPDMSIEDAMKRLQVDLISGTAGDLVDLESLSDLATRRSYATKGVLEDLYGWMEADPSFHKEDYLENLFQANEIDGKLYNFVPLFKIHTVFGKTSEVGEGYQWTVDEFYDFYQTNSHMALFAELTQEKFLEVVSSLSTNELIDWEERSCSFASNEFITFLKIAKSLPKQVDEFVDEMDLIYNGQVSLSLHFGYGRELTGYILARKLFQEPVSLIGFPTAGKNGSAFQNIISLGICSSSSKKEGAWEFLKSFAADTYEEQLKGTGAFWFRKDFIEQNFETISEDESILNEQIGNGVSGWQINLETPTEEDISVLRDWLYSIQWVYEYDPVIRDIIIEEARFYCAGQQEAEEVAETIQSRVSLYLKESK